MVYKSRQNASWISLLTIYRAIILSSYNTGPTTSPLAETKHDHMISFKRVETFSTEQFKPTSKSLKIESNPLNF